MAGEKEVKSILVRNIKRYRARAGFTQEQAAEKTGITVKYWQRLEMTSQPDLPSLPLLNKISKVLRIKLHNLLKN